MKKSLLLPVLLSLASPAAATELDFQAITGGELGLRGEIGFGNWLTPTLYEQGVQGITQDERTLESFSFFLQGTGDLTYRTAVGVLDGIRLSGDVYTTDWQTIGTGTYEIETVISGGLFLDPTVNYVLYIIPQGTLNDVYEWAIETTLTNRYIGVVGSSPQMYSISHQVDLDLAQDRDVAMQARISAVPEPSTLLMLASGLFVAVGALRWMRR